MSRDETTSPSNARQDGDSAEPHTASWWAQTLNKWLLAVIGSLIVIGLGIAIDILRDIRTEQSTAATERAAIQLVISTHSQQINSLQKWGPDSGSRVTATDLDRLTTKLDNLQKTLGAVSETVARLDERTARP